MLLQSPHEYALLLLAVRNSVDGIYRFAGVLDRTQPGFLLKIKPVLSIENQFLELLAEHLKIKALPSLVHFVEGFACDVKLKDGQVATMFLATLDYGEGDCPEPLASIPDVIRGLPKDRNRLPYLKAWQVLAGGLSDENRVVEVADLVKALKSEDKPVN